MFKSLPRAVSAAASAAVPAATDARWPAAGAQRADGERSHSDGVEVQEKEIRRTYDLIFEISRLIDREVCIQEIEIVDCLSSCFFTPLLEKFLTLRNESV